MRRRRTGGPTPAWLAALLVVVVLFACARVGMHATRTLWGGGGQEPPATTSSEPDGGQGDGTRQQSDSPDRQPRDEVGEGADDDEPSDGHQEGIRSYEEEGTVEQVASRLLASYRDAGDCTLAEAGYLDLLGKVWGCVVGGDGWSEVCVVWEDAEDASCTVRVLRIDRADIGQVFGEEDGNR